MAKKVNPYGLCRCVQCKRGKRNFKKTIRQKAVKRLRKPFGNKEPKKGFYTD